MPASQAGRRRFEPGLPLHLFNSLGKSTDSSLFRYSIKPDALTLLGVGGCGFRSTAALSFLSAARVCSRSELVYTSKQAPIPWPLWSEETFGSTRTVAKVRERYNPSLRLAGVLLGNYDRTATLDKDIHNMLKKRFGEEVVFNTTIGRSVRMREATVRGLTIFELPEAQGAGPAVLDPYFTRC
jgi:hypothetical protein